MKKRIVNSLLLMLCFLLAECGTTKIMTDQNLAADIYLNGVKKGRKEIEIQRMGIPKKIELTAKYQGETIGTITVRRKFDYATCLIGYFTEGIGLLTAWRFPETIIIPTKVKNSDELTNPWNNAQKSIWLKPVNK